MGVVSSRAQSGRTQALIDDMFDSYLNNTGRMSDNVCFFSENQAQSDSIRRRIPRGILNGPVFLTYNNLRALRGLDTDCLYLDDFIQGPNDYSRRRNFFETIMPLFCHNIRIVIASLIKEMFFDTQGWTFRELAPQL